MHCETYPKNHQNVAAGGFCQSMCCHAPSSKPVAYYSTRLQKQLHELFHSFLVSTAFYGDDVADRSIGKARA